ncbi:MAG: amino acid--tRNA ligase-related protein [Planctomycetota bacterium]
MADATETPELSASEYEQERRKKRQTLVDAGLDVYGRRTQGITPVADAPQPPQEGEGDVVKVAGRVVLKRDMGKLSFLTIRDATGDLQIGLQKNRLDDDGWLIRQNLDLGDQIVAEGPIGLTKTGQPTVWATAVSMASKSLVVPPDKHKGLADPELRYRQRYVDLWANPESMEVMQKRFAIIDAMRNYLKKRGFVEVETPMLQPIHGGAAARPFETKHNAYGMDLFLRIAPELYLKRLVVGGMPKVFEINRNFRNEGVSPKHNPEFTMLEAYEAYGNWETMAELVEDMICTVAMEVLGTTKITIGEKEVDLGKRPWRRASLVELVEERTRWHFDKRPLQDCDPDLFYALVLHKAEDLRAQVNETTSSVIRRIKQDAEAVTKSLAETGDVNSFGDLLGLVVRAAPSLKRHYDDIVEVKVQNRQLTDPERAADQRLRQLSPFAQLVEVYERFVEPALAAPVFITRFPSTVIPLARPSEDDSDFCDVYELAIGGQEISPGYTELNDPDVQARLFQEQVVEDEGERQKVDHDFLHALKVGMPPAGGMGLGVDRLVMLLLGQPSIRDVLAFPLMKPQS